MPQGSLRERLSALSRGEIAGLVVVVAVVLAGSALWYVRSLPREVQVRAVRPAAVRASASASPSPVTIVVDVAGWVRHPGVYEFPEGSRVIDALDAAGGARPGAALEMLNLAAPLTDGSQILVVRAQAAAAPAGALVPPAGAAPAKVNINTASATELEVLPGVGEVIAQRIVDYRTENGPFGSVDELLDVSGIGEATLDEMREQVTV